jgi:hypothetical protein
MTVNADEQLRQEIDEVYRSESRRWPTTTSTGSTPCPRLSWGRSWRRPWPTTRSFEGLDAEIEIRQVFEVSDFPPDILSPEAAAREQELREGGWRDA